MAPPRRKIETSFVFFDVYYVDDSRTSNRKVPATALDTAEENAELNEGGLDGTPKA
jgi:hypothetical protein